MKKVLFITQYIPYAANSGITVKILNLLKCMTALCDVECVFLCEDRHEAERSLQKCDINVKNQIIYLEIPSETARRYLIHLYQILFVRKSLRKELRKIIQTCQPDLFWIEFGYVCHLIPFLRQFGKPIYYGSHNSQFQLEFTIWKNIPDALQKIKRLPMLGCHWVHENLFFPMADKILCISEGDLQYYKQKIPANKLGIMAYFFDESHLMENAVIEKKNPFILLVGSLKSYQNFDAAVFTLTCIWPEIAKNEKDLSLYVVGKTPESATAEYAELPKLMLKQKNVYITGEVESVVPYVKSALVNIVPIRIGSGVRTKIIESAACKTPVVSTSIGADGLPFVNGESIYIADDPEEFAKKVIELVNKPEKRRSMGKSAYDTFEKYLSLKAGKEKLTSIFNKANRPT